MTCPDFNTSSKNLIVDHRSISIQPLPYTPCNNWKEEDETVEERAIAFDGRSEKQQTKENNTTIGNRADNDDDGIDQGLHKDLIRKHAGIIFLKPTNLKDVIE